MKNLIFLFNLIFILGCNENKNQDKEIDRIGVEKTRFNIADYLISKESLGKIKVGQSISQIDKIVLGLTKKAEPAENLGFFGGGNAFLYSKDSNILFALVPNGNTDTIKYILVFSKEFKTTNGLNPNSKVNEILKVYPNFETLVSLTTDEEVFSDDENSWSFCFFTEKGKRIGKYKEEVDGEESGFSKPKILNIECGYILISSKNDE